MSVATPWPLASRPWARSITVTSPSASSPSVDRRDRVLAELALGPGRPPGSRRRSRRPGRRRPTRRPTSSPAGSRDRDPGARVAARRRPRPRTRRARSARALAHLVGDDRLEVEGGHLLLLVGDLLEPLERLVQRVALDLEAELLERVLERVAAGVLAEHDLVRARARRRGASMISNVVRSLSTPSWWIPDSWANALRPTIALFGGTA